MYTRVFSFRAFHREVNMPRFGAPRATFPKPKILDHMSYLSHCFIFTTSVQTRLFTPWPLPSESLQHGQILRNKKTWAGKMALSVSAYGTTMRTWDQRVSGLADQLVWLKRQAPGSKRDSVSQTKVELVEVRHTSQDQRTEAGGSAWTTHLRPVWRWTPFILVLGRQMEADLRV